MNKKTARRVGGGISIYYGISCLVAGIGGFIAIGVMLFKVFSAQADVSWGTLLGLTIISTVVGAVGYSILRVGYEELEE